MASRPAARDLVGQCDQLGAVWSADGGFSDTVGFRSRDGRSVATARSFHRLDSRVDGLLCPPYAGPSVRPDVRCKPRRLPPRAAHLARGQRPRRAATARTPAGCRRAERVRGLRDWQRTLAEARWVGITWPREYGGRDARHPRADRLRRGDGPGASARGDRQLWASASPGRRSSPTAPRSRRRASCPASSSADDLWCFGFSEPGAGSDLASLRTQAVLDGDHFRVTGQKVWTTLAQHADWCMLLCRTDPETRRAQGHLVPAGRHAEPGHRGATAAADDRRGRVQRGVLRRRAGAARESARRAPRRLADRRRRRCRTSAASSTSSACRSC